MKDPLLHLRFLYPLPNPILARRQMLTAQIFNYEKLLRKTFTVANYSNSYGHDELKWKYKLLNPFIPAVRPANSSVNSIGRMFQSFSMSISQTKSGIFTPVALH